MEKYKSRFEEKLAKKPFIINELPNSNYECIAANSGEILGEDNNIHDALKKALESEVKNNLEYLSDYIKYLCEFKKL